VPVHATNIFNFFIQMEMTKIVVLGVERYPVQGQNNVVHSSHVKKYEERKGVGFHPHYLTYRSIFVGHYEGAFNCNLVVLRASVIYSHRRLLK